MMTVNKGWFIHGFGYIFRRSGFISLKPGEDVRCE
jgi:hypothetical protein